MNPIAITMGDPAGIGPEVTLSAINKLNAHPGIILFGHPDQKPRGLRNLSADISENKITFIECGKGLNISTKYHDASNAQIAYDCLLKALQYSQNNAVSGLVTAPISKEGFFKAGIKTTDHTSLLKQFFDRPNASMGFYSKPLKVILATIHIGLSNVEKLLTPATIEAAINNALLMTTMIGIKNPKIGVAGLNPHAGENGQFGDFEIKTLQPVIDSFKSQNISISDPISPDIIFRKALDNEFDIVIAMYHDQGLIPLKMVAFDSAVNVTLGLPIIRTSPDHGTAYDIAGKGIANPNAMLAAIEYIINVNK